MCVSYNKFTVLMMSICVIQVCGAAADVVRWGEGAHGPSRRGEGHEVQTKYFYWTDHFYIKIDNIRLVQGSSTETKKKFNFLKTYVVLG